MTKNKTIGSIILVLTLALSVFFLLVIPNEITKAVWITLIFDAIAFISQLILWILMLKKADNKEEVFYKTPVMLASTIYLIIQFIICVVVAFSASTIGDKVILIINFVLLILMWILILALISAKDHVKKVDSRQKDHHIEL